MDKANALLQPVQGERKSVALIHLDNFYAKMASQYSLGLLSIATVLQQGGFDVKYFEAKFLFYADYKSREQIFRKFRYRVVGFYVNSDNFFNVVTFAKDLKRWIPDVKIVAGGPLASSMPEKILAEEAIDYVVMGEGEYPMLSLCEYLIRGIGSLDKVLSLVYREGGKIVFNERAPLIRDLDVLPPINYSFLSVVPPDLSYSSGRGCPYKCAFCSQSVHGQGYRYFSPERVVREIIDNMQRMGCRLLIMLDDTFVANPARAMKICDMLKKEKAHKGLDFLAFCEGRIDTLHKHPEVIPKLSEANFTRIQIGVENGNQEILDLYDKKITLAQVESVVNQVYLTQAMTITSNIILSAPFETDKTFEKSLDFVVRLMHDAPGVFEPSTTFLCPYPGTKIAGDLDSFGLSLVDPEFLMGLTTYTPCCETQELSMYQILHQYSKFKRTVKMEMEKVARKMPYKIIDMHMMSLLKYGVPTNYSSFLSKWEVFHAYYELKASKRFYKLDDIPSEELEDWYPMRIIPQLDCSDDGDFFELIGYFDPVFVVEKDEMAVYAHSSGKLTIGEIAEVVREKVCRERTKDEVIRRLMIPLYKRLEQSFHVIFQR